MNLTTYALALSAAGCALLYTGCDDRDDRHDPSAAVTLESQADDDVWITIDADALPDVARLQGYALRTDGLDQHGAPVAVQVPRRLLSGLAELAHEEHGRCGGFMLHDDAADAAEAVESARAADFPLYQAVASVYRVDNAAAVASLMSAVREDSLLAVLQKLVSYPTRHHASATGLEAARWLHETWSGLTAGRSDASAALVTHTRTKQPSVSLTIRGSKLPDEHVILGGHLDSIALRGSVAPGADDNASGIATLTEVARTLLASGFVPERTVTFYAYAAEEVGLVGSAEIATAAKNRRLKVTGALQYDMVNYTAAREPYVALVRDNTDAGLNAFTEQLVTTYLRVPVKYLSCGYACSDHASWSTRGFPATFPHEALMSEDSSKFIHTATDTLARSNNAAKHALLFARLGVAFVAELAKGKLPTAADR